MAKNLKTIHIPQNVEEEVAGVEQLWAVKVGLLCKVLCRPCSLAEVPVYRSYY